MATTGSQLVVAAAIVRGGRLLCAQRTAPESLAGLWEFPGGKLEAGEQPAAGLQRELVEELGMRIEVGAVLQSAHPGGNWPLANGMAMRVFHATSNDDVQFLAVHRQVRWVALERAQELAWIPADLPILAALQAAYGSARRVATDSS